MAISGHGGYFRFQGNSLAGCKSWSLDQEVNIMECTDFDSAGNREYVSGLKSFSGSADCNWVSTVSIAVGDTGNCRLDYDATTAVSGTIYISSIGHTTNVDGVVEATIGFTGTGTLPS